MLKVIRWSLRRTFLAASAMLRVEPFAAFDELDDLLADAVDESGCSFIAEHFRSPGPHFRGCFALDFILRKD
jgi:hypothetical protein